MKAQDINLTLEEALAKSPSFLKRKIEYSVNLIRKAEKMALRLDPDEGFYNTFSGGKDSQCLFHLMKMAGVRFETHMSLTSVDPAEVIRFVKREYPCVRLTPPECQFTIGARTTRDASRQGFGVGAARTSRRQAA